MRHLPFIARCLAVMAMLLSSLAIYSKERDTDTLFSRYSGKEGYSSVTYGKKMLEIMKKNASPDVARILEGIVEIRIISGSGTGQPSLYDEACGITANGGYGLISEIAESGTSTSFFIREEDGDMSSFLMISRSDGKETVLDIYGVFDIQDISKLAAIPAGR